MAEELIISVSGMRGIVGQNLTPSIAADYGSAFGTFLKKAENSGMGKLSVCIGTDSRPSGQTLKSAVIEGLRTVGIDVIDLGMVTTPCVGIMLKELGCNGGVVITASHNPIQYNGIKLLLANAIAPPPHLAEQIKNHYLDKCFDLAVSTDCGTVTTNLQTHAVHIKKVTQIVDKELIASKKFKVVTDSVNGAGGPITKKLLAEFGCNTVAINDQPTGLFAHTPEPIAENLTQLCEVVKAEKAQIGFAQDPDADRLAIVDDNGSFIGEEYSLALAARYIFSQNTGSAAANLSTSRMIDDIAEKTGNRVYRTAVGEANVASAMLEHNCIIGGEGNGGVIDLRVVPIRDSLVAIALVLQLMAQTDKSVSQLVREIDDYHMSKEKFQANKLQANHILDEVKKLFAYAKLNTTDGCRFDFDDGWLHLRISNTEPVMRVIVEAIDRDTAQKYIDAVTDIRKKILG